MDKVVSGMTFKARGLIREMVERNDGEMQLPETDAREELYQLGYITRGSRGGNWFEATAAGIHAAARIVRDSGDGPEDLKALMAPLVRPTR